MDKPVPTEIALHRASRTLEIAYVDGRRFHLPCEYLRVFSPAAEAAAARRRGDPRLGRDVNITRITPTGSYALQLHFDDGHDRGVYSFQTLYTLGMEQEQNWSDFLARREAQEKRLDQVGPARLKLLYFAKYVDLIGQSEETVTVPDTVRDMGGLIDWLRARGPAWQRASTPGLVTVTVNREFADPATPVRDGDECSFTPIYKA